MSQAFATHHRNRYTVNGQKTKKQYVSEALEALNFYTEQVPGDWFERVEKALERQGITAHETTIYTIRRREIERRKQAAQQGQDRQTHEKQVDLPVSKPSASQPSQPSPGLPPHIVSRNKDVLSNLTVQQALAVKEFAQQFGGLQGLAQVSQVCAQLFE